MSRLGGFEPAQAARPAHTTYGVQARRLQVQACAQEGNQGGRGRRASLGAQIAHSEGVLRGQCSAVTCAAMPSGGSVLIRFAESVVRLVGGRSTCLVGPEFDGEVATSFHDLDRPIGPQRAADGAIPETVLQPDAEGSNQRGKNHGDKTGMSMQPREHGRPSTLCVYGVLLGSAFADADRSFVYYRAMDATGCPASLYV